MPNYYQYPQDEIDALIIEKRQNLKQSQGVSNLAEYGLKTVANRLNKDKRRYRDYGVYWWALKDALANAGHYFGDVTDNLIKADYSGKNPTETLVMADKFRHENLAQNMVYTNKFMINDDGDFYTLFDDDMESD